MVQPNIFLVQPNIFWVQSNIFLLETNIFWVEPNIFKGEPNIFGLNQQLDQGCSRGGNLNTGQLATEKSLKSCTLAHFQCNINHIFNVLFTKFSMQYLPHFQCNICHTMKIDKLNSLP